MTSKTTVLVTGATGRQGGAVARLLLERGHAVRAVTRKPESHPAKALAEKGVEVVKGDLTDRAALDAAVKGVNAVFLVTTPYEAGPAAETKQGTTVADAAKAAGAFLLFSSVANADKATGIPHFESKFAVEKHIRASGAQATIIAPVAFMENVFFGGEQLAKGTYAVPLAPTRKLAQIAVRDIAAAAVSVLEDPSRYAGKRYDLAGDELSGEDCARALTAVAGKPIAYLQLPLDSVRKRMGDDGARMYEWFEGTGYSFDRGLLARDFPGVTWTTFEVWARAVKLALFG